MYRAIAVWSLAIVYPCILHWVAASDVFLFSPAPVPWEIYGYGLQKKIVSPVLEKFFYKRGYYRSATTAITLEEVMEAVMTQVGSLAVSSP